jgi:polysaccharide biosynthesis/export protein
MISPLSSGTKIAKLSMILPAAALLVVATAVPGAFAQATRVAPLYQQSQGDQPGVQNQPGQQPGFQMSQASPPNGQALPPSAPRGGDLVLGPGDVLQIQVADEPDINGKYLVSDSGDLAIPMVPKPVRAGGLTTSQVSRSIEKALKTAEILQNPVVSVFVEEYNSHTVTVVGAVVRPGLYPVETHTTVLQAISEAGGLLPNAGNMVTVAKAGSTAATTLRAEAARPQSVGNAMVEASAAESGHQKGGAAIQNASLETTPPTGRDVVHLDFGKLVSGTDPSVNIEVRAGDVVSVGTAPVVYIVGAVTKPGAFAIESDDSRITVLQALALVQGMTSVASAGHAVIVRNSGSEKDRKEIPLDINKLKTGKQQDPYLEANDILFIPESGMKKSLHALGSAAAHAASEVAGYGMALRVGTF